MNAISARRLVRRNGPRFDHPFLPTTMEEVRARGWDGLDVIIVSGDAYVDHPAFGPVLIARFLEGRGLGGGGVAPPHRTLRLLGGGGAQAHPSRREGRSARVWNGRAADLGGNAAIARGRADRAHPRRAGDRLADEPGGGRRGVRISVRLRGRR